MHYLYIPVYSVRWVLIIIGYFYLHGHYCSGIGLVDTSVYKVLAFDGYLNSRVYGIIYIEHGEIHKENQRC